MRVRSVARQVADDRIYGRERYQPLFRALHRVALAGMNFGLDDPRRNGEYRLLESLAREWRGGETVVFDVGANVGDWTEHVARVLPDARLYAFEPTARAAQLEARVGAVARTFAFGFGSADAEAEIYAPPDGHALASVYPRDLRHKSLPTFEATETVSLRRLDSFLADEGITRVDFLKLDVEGHELAVLEGAGDALHDGTIRALQFEFGGTALDARVFLRDFVYLLQDRYDVYRILRDGLASIRRWRESDEVFLYANYVALWRRER